MPMYWKTLSTWIPRRVFCELRTQRNHSWCLARQLIDCKKWIAIWQHVFATFLHYLHIGNSHDFLRCTLVCRCDWRRKINATFGPVQKQTKHDCRHRHRSSDDVRHQLVQSNIFTGWFFANKWFCLLPDVRGIICFRFNFPLKTIWTMAFSKQFFCCLENITRANCSSCRR